MKKLAFFIGWVACVAVVCTLAVSSAHAQTASSGSISGLVTDPQGGVVPGADVTLTDIATNSKQNYSNYFTDKVAKEKTCNATKPYRYCNRFNVFY